MGAETKTDVPYHAADGFCLLGQDAGREQASREQHAASPERRKFREAVQVRHARSRQGAMGWTAGDGSGEHVCGVTSCLYPQNVVKSGAESRMDQVGLTTIALAPGQRPAMLAVGLFWTNSTSRRDRAHRLIPRPHQRQRRRDGGSHVCVDPVCSCLSAVCAHGAFAAGVVSDPAALRTPQTQYPMHLHRSPCPRPQM